MEEKKSLLLEGLLPVDVWNALIVLLILFGVVVAVVKGVAVIRDEVQKSKDKKKINKKDVTDEIADKVFAKVEPQIDEKFNSFEEKFDKKFEDIDRKFANDQADIKLHTTQLNDHEDRVSRLESGDRSLCQGVLALLENASLTKQTHAMQNYILTGKYNAADWEAK